MNLFGEREWWRDLWRGMPEFVQEDLAPFHSVAVNVTDLDGFETAIGQKVPEYEKRTPSVWFPEAEIGRFADKRYVNRLRPELMNPRSPVYIISKGRWETRHTAKSLDRMRVPYRIVVEPQEAEAYRAVVDPAKVLVLPFANLGQGSIPARNWVWEHAASEGHARHWILDDNIDGFFRLNRNLKVPVADGTIFRAAEEFVGRFANVAIAGFHYFMFASRKTKLPPLTLNSRVYSCILIDNALPYRWRGRYNEDTDLSLRALKDGRATVLFTAFLAFKLTTMSVRGGNTETLYAGVGSTDKTSDGRWLMAESLRQQHPDVVKITQKWGRWQHHVDYGRFRANKLKLKQGVEVADEVDDHGMVLETIA